MPRRLLIVALGALLVPASAMAATISVLPADEHNRVTAVFVAEPGESNDFRFVPGVGFTDLGAPIIGGDGCVSAGQNSFNCNPSPTDYEVYLNDGNDRAVVTGQQPGWAKLWGGDGDDNLIASSFGQWGEAYGEAGDDVVSVNGEGGQIADGGPGNDIVRIHTYGGDTTGYGGPGNDFIEFRHAVSTAPRAPTLDGGSGADTIYAWPTFSGAGTVTGGPGDDTIAIIPVPNFEFPEAWRGSSYLLLGGPGADTVTGGDSIDTVDGGPGADTINVTDGGADTVTCGTGYDTVRYDPSDTVAADCEVLLS